MVLRIHVAGWPNCGFYRKARMAIEGLSLIFPNKIACEVHECRCHGFEVPDRMDPILECI